MLDLSLHFGCDLAFLGLEADSLISFAAHPVIRKEEVKQLITRAFGVRRESGAVVGINVFDLVSVRKRS